MYLDIEAERREEQEGLLLLSQLLTSVILNSVVPRDPE